MIMSKQDCRSVRVVVVVIQNDPALTNKPASRWIGDRDLQMRRKSIMTLFPGQKNAIKPIEENTFREERAERLKTVTDLILIDLDDDSVGWKQPVIEEGFVARASRWRITGTTGHFLIIKRLLCRRFLVVVCSLLVVAMLLLPLLL